MPEILTIMKIFLQETEKLALSRKTLLILYLEELKTDLYLTNILKDSICSYTLHFVLESHCEEEKYR